MKYRADISSLKIYLHLHICLSIIQIAVGNVKIMSFRHSVTYNMTLITTDKFICQLWIVPLSTNLGHNSLIIKFKGSLSKMFVCYVRPYCIRCVFNSHAQVSKSLALVGLFPSQMSKIPKIFILWQLWNREQQQIRSDFIDWLKFKLLKLFNNHLQTQLSCLFARFYLPDTKNNVEHIKGIYQNVINYWCVEKYLCWRFVSCACNFRLKQISQKAFEKNRWFQAFVHPNWLKSNVTVNLTTLKLIRSGALNLDSRSKQIQILDISTFRNQRTEWKQIFLKQQNKENFII